jgi:hypothetical protein
MINKLLKFNKNGNLTGIVDKPRPKQKLMVDLKLSGRAETITDAARQAGYRDSSLHNVHILTQSVGVRTYLATIDKKSRKRFGMTLPDKVMNTYFEALDATKLYGKNAVEHPDHKVRIEAADRYAGFFKWKETGIEDKKNEYNQFNFFQTKAEDQEKFHANLKSFIKKSYNE